LLEDLVDGKIMIRNKNQEHVGSQDDLPMSAVRTMYGT